MTHSGRAPWRNVVVLKRTRTVVLVAILILSGQAPVIADAGAWRDVTSALEVKAGGFRMDRRTGELVQAVTVTNRTGTAIDGAMYLGVRGLDPGVTLRSDRNAAPPVRITSGDQLLRISLAQGSALNPGQQATVVVRFARPEGISLKYRPLIYVSQPQE